MAGVALRRGPPYWKVRGLDLWATYQASGWLRGKLAWAGLPVDKRAWGVGLWLDVIDAAILDYFGSPFASPVEIAEHLDKQLKLLWPDRETFGMDADFVEMVPPAQVISPEERAARRAERPHPNPAAANAARRAALGGHPPTSEEPLRA